MTLPARPMARRGKPRYSVIAASIFADNLDFGMQFDSPQRASFLFHQFDQFENVTRGRIFFIHDEISMHVGNQRAAATRAFQAKFLDETSRGNSGGIFKYAAGARSRRLRLPSFLAALIHLLFN